MQSKFHWKDVENGCFSTLTTNLKLASLFVLTTNHNHLPEESEAKQDALKQKIINSVKKDPTENIAKISENIIEDI